MYQRRIHPVDPPLALSSISLAILTHPSHSFKQAPTKLNFDLDALRTPLESFPSSSYDQQQQQYQQQQDVGGGGSSASEDDEDRHGETFVTHDSEFSFIHKESNILPVNKGSTTTRGRGGTVAGGRGGRGGGRGGKVVMTKKKRDEWMVSSFLFFRMIN